MIVLTYHRIAKPQDNPSLDPTLISATPTDFAWQMEYLARRYQVVSIDEVLASIEWDRPLSSRAVLITFDDAYRDFAENAWPILKRYGLPVVLFVPTAYPGNPERRFWWDTLYHTITFTPHHALRDVLLGIAHPSSQQRRLARLKELRLELMTVPHVEAMARIDWILQPLAMDTLSQPSMLSWDELRCLAKDGVALGPHTRTHPILAQMTEEEVRNEIRGAQDDLRREIGTVRPIFSFPGGEFDNKVVEILKQEGFRAAFTTLDGHNDLETQDPLRLCRTNITRRTSPPIFRLRLYRWFSKVDAHRHAKKGPAVTAR